MQVISHDGHRPVKAWVGTKQIEGMDNVGMCDFSAPDIEDAALQQLKNIAGLPFIHKNGVAAMPDVHWGIGATVGSVIATTTAIIPAAVGVDIGCGMNAIRTNLTASDLPDNLSALRAAIEAQIPTGQACNTDERRIDAEMSYMGSLPLSIYPLVGDKGLRRAASQIGTLGGGNHFIEICLDENQDVWIMLHTGSRGIGNIIGRYFIEKAKLRMEQHYITLPDANLAYLPVHTQDFQDYIEAVDWAQKYALENRRRMMARVCTAIMESLDRPVSSTIEAVNCHHNYIERENHFGQNLWVTRKGAIRARSGDFGVIPGSMGQRSYIVRGKGNAESYCSCSHGAGRAMSRADARRRFTVDDLAAQTAGVECRKDAAVIDEIPSSYKNIDEVMAQQTDLVEIIHTLKQVLCVKGA